MKFQCYTLGCKVNQYETQALERQLLALGHEQADRDCDLLIVNTCTVTAVADRKNRTLIRRLRRENPNAVLGVCGCYAQLKSDEVRALDVDVIGGSGDREAFLQNLLHAARERAPIVAVDEALRRREFEELPAGGLAARTRAMLKVQDGCCNFCTYCIIPYARGPVRSLPLARAVALAEGLAADGYREIVLTGIEIASWGWDFKDGSRLVDLVEAVCRAVPQVRVRLGSLEPRTVDGEFCRRLSACENLCPQFHLSMQSGSDGVLRRMHRKYDSARYFQSVELLNAAFPGCAVTTDMIVGFPGETEAEFEDTLKLIERVRYDALFTFIFSPRAGTPAASMDDPTPRAEKNQRFDRLCALQNRISEEKHRAYIGKTLRVLVDGRDGDKLTARTDGGRLVRLDGGDELIGQFLNVTVTDSTTWSLVGER